jgi:hypothetical protein
MCGKTILLFTDQCSSCLTPIATQERLQVERRTADRDHLIRHLHDHGHNKVTILLGILAPTILES